MGADAAGNRPSPPRTGFVEPSQNGSTWPVFVTVLLLCLGFLTAKTWTEVGHIRALTGMQISDPQGRQSGVPAHRVVVPATFIDAYQWLNNAQTMVRNGVFRIRRTDLDNAPYGREEPWHNGLVWWVVLLAWIYGQFNGMSTGQAVEFAAVYASPFILYLQVSVLGVLATRRYNGWLGAVLAATLLAANSGVEPFQAGYLDHHGPALVCAVSMGLFVLMAGAGWVSASETGGG